MIIWTGEAHLLADAIREPGAGAAALNASAWQAGVNPEATRGLVGAALTLTDGDAGTALWAPADPCPDDKTLLTQAAELEAHVAELLEQARRMAAACRAALDAAYARAAAAAAALAAAQAQPGHAEGAVASAEGALSAAQAEIADCEAALEVTGETGAKLDHALKCLRYVPEDMASTYEVPYRHVREAGPLPYEGDFLTGGTVTIGAA